MSGTDFWVNNNNVDNGVMNVEKMLKKDGTPRF